MELTTTQLQLFKAKFTEEVKESSRLYKEDFLTIIEKAYRYAEIEVKEGEVVYAELQQYITNIMVTIFPTTAKHVLALLQSMVFMPVIKVKGVAKMCRDGIDTNTYLVLAFQDQVKKL